MDYSQFKDALDKGPLISGTSELEGLHLRELVWIECLKALIISTQQTATEEDRSGVTTASDIIIAKNVNTACKYATRFMNQRSFFDTCYAAPLLLNRPGNWEQTIAIPGYPASVELPQYGLDTIFFNWQYDWILEKFSVSVSIDESLFVLEYGCGWDYCQMKIYIEDVSAATTIELTYNPLLDTANDPAEWTSTLYPYVIPEGVDIRKGIVLYDQYATQIDLDDQVNATRRCPNGVGINTEDGLNWNINPHDYDKDLFNTNWQILDDTSVINTIPNLGGLKPLTVYKVKIGYKCGNIEGVCTGAETFSAETSITTPEAPAYS